MQKTKKCENCANPWPVTTFKPDFHVVAFCVYRYVLISFHCDALCIVFMCIINEGYEEYPRIIASMASCRYNITVTTLYFFSFIM